jgi:hypothetical protein
VGEGQDGHICGGRMELKSVLILSSYVNYSQGESQSYPAILKGSYSDKKKISVFLMGCRTVCEVLISLFLSVLSHFSYLLVYNITT